MFALFGVSTDDDGRRHNYTHVTLPLPYNRYISSHNNFMTVNINWKEGQKHEIYVLDMLDAQLQGPAM